jgi:hypothetical protein
MCLVGDEGSFEREIARAWCVPLWRCHCCCGGAARKTAVFGKLASIHDQRLTKDDDDGFDSSHGCCCWCCWFGCG